MTDTRITTLDGRACARIHDAAVAVLADPGVEVLHEKARALLAEAERLARRHAGFSEELLRRVV